MNKIKGIIFIAGLCALLFLTQKIIQPKWYYPSDVEDHGGKSTEFSKMAEDTVDVVFTGTSHVLYGVIPMKLYKDRHIVSYNLSLSAHRISPIYYQLEGMFATQHPRVVVLDASALYLNYYLDGPWRRVLDTFMPFGMDKLNAAREYASEYIENQKKKEAAEEEKGRKILASGENVLLSETDETEASDEEGKADEAKEAEVVGSAADQPELQEAEDEETIPANDALSFTRSANSFFSLELGALLPLYQYHGRWDQMNTNDLVTKGQYAAYGKGFVFSTRKGHVWGTKESVNQALDDILSQRSAAEYRLINGEPAIHLIEKDKYRDEPDEEQLTWLYKIRDLCERNGAKLLLVKIPVISNSRDYESSWTRARSESVRAIADAAGIEYCDLVYNYEVGINTNTDFRDNGMHLNYYGARKVTAFLGLYLETVMGIKGGSDKYYNQSLPMYEKIDQAAQIQYETDWKKYMKRLKENANGKTILFSVRGLMGGRFTEKEQKYLLEAGIGTNDMEALGEEAFIGVIRDGKSVYEAHGTLPAKVSVQLDEENEAVLSSVGASPVNDRNPNASIKINDEEYSPNGLGLNIVVYDNRTQMVIDRICFYKQDADTKPRGDRNTDLADSTIKKYEHTLYNLYHELYAI